MRQKKAKAIKKQVYKDQSTRRSGRTYVLLNGAKPQPSWGRATFPINPVGTIANDPDSLRAKYQQRKKESI